MKYDYRKLYNEHWAKSMEEEFQDIDSIGITRLNSEGIQEFGFSNVYAEDQSPYDFCARIGLTILRELSKENVDYLNIVKGCYMFGCKQN